MTIVLCAERGRKNKPSINSVNSMLPLRKKMYFVSDIINTVSRFYPIIEKEAFAFLFSFLYYKKLRQSTPPFTLFGYRKNYDRQATSGGRCPLFYTIENCSNQPCRFTLFGYRKNYDRQATSGGRCPLFYNLFSCKPRKKFIKILKIKIKSYIIYCICIMIGYFCHKNRKGKDNRYENHFGRYGRR